MISVVFEFLLKLKGISIYYKYELYSTRYRSAVIYENNGDDDAALEVLFYEMFYEIRLEKI